MRVVVTGSRGFIGNAVREHLEALGHEVVAAEGEGGGRVDLGDVRRLAEAFRGAEAVVHAAGTSAMDAPESVLGWLEVAASENVANAARRAGVSRLVVFSSTDATLGPEPRPGWDEGKGVARPATRFGRIERAKEDVVIGAGTRDFEPVVLRAGLVYGPGDRTRAPRIIAEARAFGCIRTYGRGLAFVPTTYVGNLAHAVGLAIAASRAGHGVYHVTDREVTSQVPFFARYAVALGLDVAPTTSSLWLARIRGMLSASSDVDEAMRRGIGSNLDTRRARAELGFEAPFSQEEGMRALEAWVIEVGGVDAVRSLARPMPSEADIESIVRGASR